MFHSENTRPAAAAPAVVSAEIVEPGVGPAGASSNADGEAQSGDDDLQRAAVR